MGCGGGEDGCGVGSLDSCGGDGAKRGEYRWEVMAMVNEGYLELGKASTV